MTETNTRDLRALAFVALAVLTPTSILLVVALLGGAVPHGNQAALFAVPAALLLTTAAAFGRLVHR